MGTPDFAVPTLRSLLSSSHSVTGVVTAPDKPKGRGLRVAPAPVKEVALAQRVPVLQPESLKDQEFISALKEFRADLFLVVAFRILPAEVFRIPPLGTVNLHASLLPRYRGAAPINWALIRGEKETGVTTFFIQERVDTGSVLMQRSVPVPEEMTAGELHDVLAGVGAETALATVDLIATGRAVPRLQDDTLATPAPKIFREMCRIDWNAGGVDVHNFVRGLSPHPGAWTMHGNTVVKILRSRVSPSTGASGAGIIGIDGDVLRVGCGSGSIEVLTVQQEGRKVQSVAEFLRGYRFAGRERFE